MNDTGTISYLQPYNGKEKLFVGNDAELKISHIGQGKLQTQSSMLNLKDVLIVPNIKKNLISVSKLTNDNNCFIIFNAYGFVMKDKLGEIQGGISKMGDANNYMHTTLTTTLNKVPISL